MATPAAPPDTTERNRSQAERLSRLEGGYEHLATKADIERVLVAVERIRAEGERNRAEAKIENERARAEARADNERLRAEARADNERLRLENERLRTELERNKADIIKVIIRVAGIGVALMAAGFAFLRITGAG